MPKKLQSQTVNSEARVNQKTKGFAGRPPVNDRVTTSVSVSLTLLRAAHKAALAALSEPRKASTKNQLRDLVNGLERRLGPRLDPAWQPSGKAAKRGKAVAYRVVLPDGTDTRVASLRKAAALAGVQAASLSVGLSRGGGRYVRRRGDSALTVERIMAR